RCPHQHALESHINPLKKPRVAHAPKTESKLARPPGLFSRGLECGRHSGEASHHSAIRANGTCQQNEEGRESHRLTSSRRKKRLNPAKACLPDNQRQAESPGRLLRFFQEHPVGYLRQE